MRKLAALEWINFVNLIVIKMDLKNYQPLISNLPVRQQCFSTKRKTWGPAEREIDWLKSVNDRLFDSPYEEKSLRISRQDVFDTTNTREKILKAIYWGYPSGMRGNHFVNLLRKIVQIEKTINELLSIPNPSSDDLKQAQADLNDVTGIGISTYSKLLYFADLSFDGNPCLILDERLFNVFRNKTYLQFDHLSGINRASAEKGGYLDYLEAMKAVSLEIGATGEQLELFLFTFGNQLKETSSL